MFRVIISLLLVLSSSYSLVAGWPERIIPSSKTMPTRLTPEQQKMLDTALPEKSTPQSQYLERLLLMTLIAEPLPGVETPESLAKIISSSKLLFDLTGISLNTMFDALFPDAQTYQKTRFPGLGITLQNGQILERNPTFGRSIRGLFYNVDQRYLVYVGNFEFRIIGRDFGNMRDGARSGIMIFMGQPNQTGRALVKVKIDRINFQQFYSIMDGYGRFSLAEKRKILADILRLQMFSGSFRSEKSILLKKLLSRPTVDQNLDKRRIVVAEPVHDHLSCPRSIPTELSRALIPVGGKPLVQAVREENVSGMVIRTPVKGEEILAIDFSKIPDKAQQEYMAMMADLIRHKIDDPALSRDERQAVIDGFKTDVENMMQTGTFNPVAHRTFASIFAEYTLYNALSLGLGKLPWAMGMLQSAVVETVAPPIKFLDTTITAATCTAALPSVVGQFTQQKIDPYALVKEEGQARFSVSHPNEVAKHKPSAFMQGAAMACSAAAGMIVMTGCNVALSSVGVDDGTTSAVLAAGAVLVAKSAAEAAMLHAPTQKRIESVIRPAVGVSRAALRWLWNTVTKVPDVKDDDIYLF
jgi:hypothetical protein